MSKKTSRQEGFTLIEILVVVALIAILAAVTIVAMNPAKNFADTRNATRSADVNAILNAVTQFAAEEGNTLADLGTVSSDCDAPTCIGSNAAAPACLDLGDDTGPLVDEYIVEMPIDPSSGTAAITGYTICQTAGGRVQIDAPGAENGKTISVKR
jgi:prepilin-type N-terminal cleavage/methylation domain-containing protein